MRRNSLTFKTVAHRWRNQNRSFDVGSVGLMLTGLCGSMLTPSFLYLKIVKSA